MKKVSFLLIIFFTINLHAETDSLNKANWRLFVEEKYKLDQEKGLLEEAKYYLLNGNIDKASHTLNSLKTPSKPTQREMNSLWALIAFIKGDYQKTLNYLSTPPLPSDALYARNCVIKILASLAMDIAPEEIEKDIEHCEVLNTSSIRTTYLWPKTLLKLKEQTPFNFSKNETVIRIENQLSFTSDELLSVLKLGLYLSPPDDVLTIVPKISETSFTNPFILEIIAFLYFKKKDYVQAFNFVENLKSVNAFNLLGMLDLIKNDYQAAFQHFLQAMEKRSNSLTAIERLIPLIGLVKNWEKGIEIVKKIRETKENAKKKETLLSYFYFKNNSMLEAEETIRKLYRISGEQFPLELNLIAENIYLRRKNKKQSLSFSYESCKQFDLYSCWIYAELVMWPDYTKTLERPDPVVSSKSDELSTSSLLKDFSEVLEEDIYVYQKDIEELDDQEVKIRIN